MRVSVIAVVACCAGLIAGGAQAQGLGGGIKGGLAFGDVPNISEELQAETGTGTSVRTGFAAGGFLAIRFSNGWSIQPEVLYTQKGVSLDFSAGAERGEWKLSLAFLDVPVLARYTFGKVVRGYVFAGPSFDIQLEAKMTSNVLGERDEGDISDDVEDFEMAAVFGGGVEFGPLLIEARWSEGLTNLAKDDDGSVKSRTFLVLGGIRF
jgi:hypothetical protein